jgi:hypothetical protein
MGDGIDTDLGGELEGKSAHRLMQPCFGHDVRQMETVGRFDARARDEHDIALAPFQRVHGLSHEDERRRQVDLEHSIPSGVGDVLDRDSFEEGGTWDQ